MLSAKQVANALNSSLKSSEMQAFAVITSNGTVLESREKQVEELDPHTPLSAPNSTNNSGTSIPLHEPTSPDESLFSVDAKLQTKIYSIFAARLWKHGSEAEWIGAEAHKFRLLVYPLPKNNLLLLVISPATNSWGLIKESAFTAAQKLELITV